MTKPVSIIVTGRANGVGPVVPYSKEKGLQSYFTSTGIRTTRLVVYNVPIYQVRIEGGSVYDAVRFGLRHRDELTPDRRPCDTGLANNRICHPRWIPGYSPHSFVGESRTGAWQLLPGKNFLIHEGADRAAGQVGGSTGCIEILDGTWNDFLAEIEKLAGADCSAIGAMSKLTVTIEETRYPIAVRRP
jgi:hypothetical protein